MTPSPLFARPLVALALLAAAPAAYAQALTPAETTQVDTLVTETLAKTGVPSASIAIVRGGEIVFAKAYGKQSETMKTANPDAPYQIASVSKQFTAAALLLLENEGKLSLDDKVSKYVPGITGPSGRIDDPPLTNPAHQADTADSTAFRRH